MSIRKVGFCWNVKSLMCGETTDETVICMFDRKIATDFSNWFILIK